MAATLPETQGDGAHQPARPRARGEMIGRFVVIDRLGSGAMGVVYSAYDPELDRRVAIKILHGPGRETALPTHRRRRLLREAQALAKVAHPNVVGVHDVGVHEGDVFLAMEYVAGGTLRRWLADAPREQAAIVAAFVDAGRGLAAAHAAGIVHRDFKPDNVLVGEDGRVRVTDFGLARSDATASDGSHPSLELEMAETDADRPIESDCPSPGELEKAVSTREGVLVGTPAYMAPEQLLARPVDARADQFAFCVALYEALYGRRPFGAETLSALVFAVVEGRIDPPPSGRAVPPWLRRVLVRGIASDPADRFASMSELLGALTRDPYRARRRIVQGVGAITIAGAVFGVGVAMRPDPIDPCEGAHDRIDADWNDLERERIAAAFSRTAVPFADETWQRVDAQLTHWADAWTAQRIDACEATLVRGEQSDAKMDARVRCLDDRLQALRAIVQELAIADRTTVERAVMAAEHLPPVIACADPPLSGEVMSDDPQIAAQVAEIRREHARARAIRSAGRFAEAVTLLDDLLARAEATGDRGLVVDVQAELGAALSEDGRWDEAAAHREDAYFEARRIGRDDIAAQTAAGLVIVIGRHLARHDVGLAWVRHAEVALERVSDPVLDVTLLNGTGSVLLSKGDHRAALAKYEEAVARAEVLPPRSYNRALSINNVGLARMDLTDLDGASTAFLRAHAMFEEAIGPSHPHTAMPLSNLASIAFMQGKYDEAIAYNERVLAIREAVLDADHPSIARTLNNLANAQFFAGRKDDAMTNMQRSHAALLARLGPDHPDVAMCLNNLGMFARARGELSDAEDYHRRALAIREAALGPQHWDVAASHVNIAHVRHDRDDDADALAHYALALTIGEAALGADDPRLGAALNGIGMTKLALGRPRDAIAPLERSLALRDRDRSDPADLAETRWALALALERTGGDAARVRALVEDAHADMQAAQRESPEREKIEAWLAAHR